MKIAAEQIIGSRLGKEFSDQEATKLAELMDMRELHANEYLISEGTEDDSLHVLLEGHLEVVKQTAGELNLPTKSCARLRAPHIESCTR